MFIFAISYNIFSSFTRWGCGYAVGLQVCGGVANYPILYIPISYKYMNIAHYLLPIACILKDLARTTRSGLDRTSNIRQQL